MYTLSPTMADHQTAKIDHDNHLLLDQPLLRLPYELLRKNFRSAHTIVERDKEQVKKLLKETAILGINGRGSKDDVLKNLDALIARVKGTKEKLQARQAEEARLFRQTESRIKHLGELHDLHTLDDVKYEAWSRARLDRLLVDYLLRHGYNDSAVALSREKDVVDLVDIDTFIAMSRIQHALKRGSVVEALAWCSENKKELRKINSSLEFNLRFQQYIELVRQRTTKSMLDAITHARKYLYPYAASHHKEVTQAAALLAFPPDAPFSPKYVELYSPKRWEMLADLFTKTHNELLSLPSIPLLHVALSSGLSALKTPACHSHSAISPSTSTLDDGVENDNGNDDDVLMTSVPSLPTLSASADPDSLLSSPDGNLSLGSLNRCPICSTELNELARNVPYAHHTKSHVDHDLMLLPNGRVYGLEKLLEHAKQQGLREGEVRDLRSAEVFGMAELKKVFIT